MREDLNRSLDGGAARRRESSRELLRPVQAAGVFHPPRRPDETPIEKAEQAGAVPPSQRREASPRGGGPGGLTQRGGCCRRDSSRRSSRSVGGWRPVDGEPRQVQLATLKTSTPHLRVRVLGARPPRLSPGSQSMVGNTNAGADLRLTWFVLQHTHNRFGDIPSRY